MVLLVYFVFTEALACPASNLHTAYFPLKLFGGMGKIKGEKREIKMRQFLTSVLKAETARERKREEKM